MKKRLDVLLVERRLADSREKAKAVIMTGNVFVNGQREDKAGTTFDEEKAQIEIKGHTMKYVSRGGYKLEKQSMCSEWMSATKYVWISAHLPEDLQTVCSRTEPSKYFLWMWDGDSWTGNFVRMSGSSVWKRPISDM